MSGALGVTRLLHAAVNTASDPSGLRAFYAELLGDPGPRPPIDGVDGVWLADAQVHLVETAGDGPRGPHWCLGVQSLARAREALQAAGVEILEGSQTWPDGRRVEQLWFRDPIGTVIELQEDPAG